jgi:hypothetical protein
MSDAAFPYCGWTPFHRLLISLTAADLSGDFSAKDIARILARAQCTSSGSHIKQALQALGFIDSSKRATPALAHFVAAAGPDRKAILRERLRLCYSPHAAAPPPEKEMTRRLRQEMTALTGAKAASFFCGAAKWAELYTAPTAEGGTVTTLCSMPGAKVEVHMTGDPLQLRRAFLTAVYDVAKIFAGMQNRPEAEEHAAEMLAIVREAMQSSNGLAAEQLLAAMRKTMQPLRKGPRSEVAEMPMRGVRVR